MRLITALSTGVCILGVVVVEALPRRAHTFVKRQVTELREEYDFVVVGGGTSGLTIADRVSAAFPEKNVLVIEYGKIEGTVGYYDPPEDGRGASRLVISSPPVASVNNRAATVLLGMTVGGGSAINGQFLDRGSRYDYDEWARLGSPQFDDSPDSWDWENFGPAFKKANPRRIRHANAEIHQSFFLTEPNDELVEKYGYTWNASAYTGDAIEASFPPFQWPAQRFGWRAFEEFGLDAPASCDDGDKHGICWVPTAQNSETVERSHAGVGHYTRIAETRPNLDLLVEHKVTRLVVDKDKTSVPAVEFRPVAPGGEVRTIRPKHEVILSAGAVHTPQILQRSGIASSAYLESEGIELVEDLPGVGQNFQDHCGVPVAYSYDTPRPSEADVANNATYAAEAVAQFRERPARGPYTLAMGNSAAYVALRHVTPEWERIVADIRAQIGDRSVLRYLPAGAAEPVREGYMAQLEIIAQALEHPEHPILEMPFQAEPGTGFLLKPLSRGSVVLNSTDHDATPVVNYATGANPVDLEIMAAYVDYFRRLYSTDTWQGLGAVEVAPGAHVTDHDALIEYVKDNVIQSLMHPCCTAAMLPREKGGVVDSSLSVYGIPGLRVADCSIIPTIPAAHTTTTAYAIGEKAAEIIIRRWKKKCKA
ncbi:GMC oxidoreductase [Colletotrichum higginsianum IMI 349063]|uniref:GMC oxidoreductase n=1 Tax=Colletotrichum higginsianum (strain IMI 349063) TaxID=759273 RepID=A0A1B7YLC1_COLHI|nr:GMC oxidoreductase [Colletotrichum higginsianum IMI 349063]OBR12843.1 GMC oxidoreductase [Colletotrichum higginsianum IMI 349063]